MFLDPTDSNRVGDYSYKGEVVSDSASFAGNFVQTQKCGWRSLRQCISNLLPGTACSGTHLEEKDFRNIPEKLSVNSAGRTWHR